MFRVVRSNLWQHSSFADRLAQEPDIALDTFDRQGDPGSIWEMLSRADCYQITSARDELPVTYHAGPALIARCPELLCVSAGGAGFDTVDVGACTAAGVLVLNQAGANAQSVAEATLGLMIDVTHRISLSDRRLRKERGFTREDLMGEELAGKTLGIVGIGHVGRKVARLAAAFGMKVLACDPLLAEQEVSARGAEPVSLQTLLAQSDIVSVHCPRDSGTLGLFNASAFAAMKEGAYFINTARGGIHDQTALLAALQSGHLRGAGLDVWAQEPPALDDPLLHHSAVVANYHTAGVTIEARARTALWAADQLVAMFRGQAPERAVNPEVWPQVSQKLAQRRARASHRPASGKGSPDSA